MRSRPLVGPKSGGGRGEKIAPKPADDQAFTPLVAGNAQKTHIRAKNNKNGIGNSHLMEEYAKNLDIAAHSLMLIYKSRLKNKKVRKAS